MRRQGIRAAGGAYRFSFRRSGVASRIERRRSPENPSRSAKERASEPGAGIESERQRRQQLEAGLADHHEVLEPDAEAVAVGLVESGLERHHVAGAQQTVVFAGGLLEARQLVELVADAVTEVVDV